jgi:hypothetical protein
MKHLFSGLLGIAMASIFTGCKPVKEYQKAKINDNDMQLANFKSEKFEQNFEMYREAGAGANGSKTGGGCGCN